jgi:hypothetical protein
VKRPRAPRSGPGLRRYQFWRFTEPIEWLDNLIHHPRMGWIPRPLTSWVCDWMDWKLGLTWHEIRLARHGGKPGYTNQLDWRLYLSEPTTTAGSNVVVHWKSGEQA